jgi:hypothetical protein
MHCGPRVKSGGTGPHPHPQVDIAVLLIIKVTRFGIFFSLMLCYSVASLFSVMFIGVSDVVLSGGFNAVIFHSQYSHCETHCM